MPHNATQSTLPQVFKAKIIQQYFAIEQLFITCHLCKHLKTSVAAAVVAAVSGPSVVVESCSVVAADAVDFPSAFGRSCCCSSPICSFLSLLSISLSCFCSSSSFSGFQLCIHFNFNQDIVSTPDLLFFFSLNNFLICVGQPLLTFTHGLRCLFSNLQRFLFISICGFFWPILHSGQSCPPSILRTLWVLHHQCQSL